MRIGQQSAIRVLRHPCRMGRIGQLRRDPIDAITLLLELREVSRRIGHGKTIDEGLPERRQLEDGQGFHVG